jgi:hypothetical protein
LSFVKRIERNAFYDSREEKLFYKFSVFMFALLVSPHTNHVNISWIVFALQIDCVRILALCAIKFEISVNIL